VKHLKRALHAFFLRLETLLEAGFGPRLNPLTQLGTLGWYLFWIVVASGIYVYVFFDTGVTQAWQSLERMGRVQPYAGGIMRSLHRYASDALVVVVLVHAVREFAMDRMRGNRWFPWLTGVPLLWFLYVSGITGYWLVWDRLAQFVAVETTQWLDALGIFAEPIARNFLDEQTLSGRFFTLMVYMHIAVPLMMLLAMWIHIQRHAHARVNPPRGLAVGTLAALVLLSLAWPAVSQPPADLDSVPARLGFDWFYLAVYRLLPHLGGATLWALLIGGSFLLAALPWLPPLRKGAPARVDLANCNGCARCFADCPFGAITMVPRTDGLPYEQQAEVHADLCMSCGICVGACPTATPFRRASALVAGIELPDRPLAGLREEVTAATTRLEGPGRIVVFHCAHDATDAALADASTAVVGLPCVGQVPPPFIDWILSRRLAEGVFLSGCSAHDCYERLGDRWTEQRIAGTRDPRLRDRVPKSSIALHWANASRRQSVAAALDRFRDRVRHPAVVAGTASAPRVDDTPVSGPGPRPSAWRIALQVGCYAAFVAALGYFATQPAHTALPGDVAVLKLAFSHAGAPLKPCRRHTAQELADLPFAERSATTCERGRWPVRLELDVDGRPRYAGTHEPAGLWNDGPSSAYVPLVLPAGTHRLDVRLRDDGDERRYGYVASREVTLAAGQNFVIEFDANAGGFVFGHARKAGAKEGARP
jgi:ferredoxin/coenzyme F420-reducing hydrogenase delta subunit